MKSLKPGCVDKWEFFGSGEDWSLKFSGLSFSNLYNIGIRPVEA